jgi:hypothetical protein
MMKEFIDMLQFRNGPLFMFGCGNLLAALLFLLLARFSKIRVRSANAWLKPFKFALSIALFSWTMGWYAWELDMPGTVRLYNWIVIVLLGFETVYIALQAGRGQLSHYNVSSRVYGFLTVLMAVAATVVTLWTAYIGILFCTADLGHLPAYYVLSICMAIGLFVIFAFQGAAMGAKATHTVGGPEGGPVLPLLNWSMKHGDLRIAHFTGMHALQVLPLLSWYVLKNNMATVIVGLLYALLAVFTCVRALRGKGIIARKPGRWKRS